MALLTRAFVVSSLTLSTAAGVLSFGHNARADSVVQIPVDSLLDGRSVSTLNGQAIVTWSNGQGVDGDGYADGFVTNAVEAVLLTQNKTENGKLGAALPDDGKFPATARYPEIQLHFANSDATGHQTHQLHMTQGPQTLEFNAPQASYSKMFLFITCSEGAAALTITLNYANGVAPTVTKLTLPDYGIGGASANDPVFFNLIGGMHKWNTMNQEGDSATHTITGIELNPTSTATLTSIQVAKTNNSHAVFWGATGVATSAIVGSGAGGSGAGGVTGGSGAGSGGAASGGEATSGGTSAGGSTSIAAGGGGASPASAGAGGNAGAGHSAGASGGGDTGMTATPSSSDDSSGCSIGNPHATPRAFAWLALAGLCGLRLRRKARNLR